MNIETLVEVKPNPNIPSLAPGDTVKVSSRVVEGDKERIQQFQGVVIKVRSRGVGSSFTVRRVTYGVGVERTFPLYSPRVEKVEVVRRGKVRRAKLYYLRGLSAKTSRLKERRLSPRELEREQAEALRLKEQQELEQEQARAQKPAEEPEAVQEESPVMEQETAVEEEREEAPEQEPEAVQEESPVMEQETAVEEEQEEVPAAEQEPELMLEESPGPEKEEKKE